MTDRPPMTDAELLDLGYKLDRLRDELDTAPAFGEATLAGHLIDADHAALTQAKHVIDRLYRWRHWTSIATDSYLPAPTLELVQS
jgi:hypothetical protein